MNVLDRVLQSKVFQRSITLLIVLSIVSFCVETLPNLSPSFRSFLQKIEIVTVVIFTLEYLARIYVSKHRLNFVFSFMGIVDLLAILPFYLASSVDLRSLRIFRLFRMLRILKLLRYSDAIMRLLRALYQIKDELVIFGIATLMMLFLAAVGIYHFEHAAQPEVFSNVFDCLWWAVATLTTVGYGDVYPITIGGRLFTFLILMLGLGLVAVPTGLISSALTSLKSEERSGS